MQAKSYLFTSLCRKGKEIGESAKNNNNMAKVKSIVAEMVKSGKSFKGILDEAKEKEATKWEMLKVFLWTMYWKVVFKFSYWFEIFSAIVFFILCVIFNLMVAIVSPLWYPILMGYAPKKAANFIAQERELSDKIKGFKGIVIFFWQLSKNFIFYCGMGFCWGWTWRFMPMSKRQYYIDAAGIDLKTLKATEQVEYYNLQSDDDKIEALRKADIDAERILWEKGYVGDRANILKVYYLSLGCAQELFRGSEEMVELLKNYCANTKRKLVSEIIWFFVQQLSEGKPSSKADEVAAEATGTTAAQDRAFELLKVCAENRTFEAHVLRMLVTILDSEDTTKGVRAEDILYRYFGKNSFPEDVITFVLMNATSRVVNAGKERCKNLLFKIARREGLSVENAETFYHYCSEFKAENVEIAKEMDAILKMRMDLQTLWSCSDDEEGRAKWLQYCSLKQYISTDAQLQMKEWQYDIFKQTLHELSAGVIYDFLVKRLSEREKSYFEKVLDEEQIRETLNENALKLILLTPWKRDIVLTRLEASQKIGGLVL